MKESSKLNEYTEDEFYSVALLVNPDLTRDAYHAMWEAFQDAKAERYRMRRLQ